MAHAHNCPKCHSAMIEGFVMDNTYGTLAVSAWVEGAPKKSIWVGVKLDGQKPIEIETWRCGKCGFLESYAPPA
jgi:predicted Zn-ribbon and HTH transcriptional regulator